MKQIMKSTVLNAQSYGQPEVLEFTDYTLPPLNPDMARIQVKAAGINPIDARRMTGESNMQNSHKPLELSLQG